MARTPAVRIVPALLLLALAAAPARAQDGPAEEAPPEEEAPAAEQPGGPDIDPLSVPPTEPFAAVPSESGAPSADIARSSPVVQALLGALGTKKPRLLVSLSASEMYFANFNFSPTEPEPEYRTTAAIGAVYEHLGPTSYLTLAASTSAAHDLESGANHRGFANADLRFATSRPRLRFALIDRFARGDTPEDLSSSGLRRQRKVYLRNSFSPSLRYQISPLSSFDLTYVQTFVHSEAQGLGSTLDQVARAVFRKRFGPFLDASLSQSFNATLSDTRPDSLGYSADARLRRSFGRDYRLAARASASIADRGGETPQRRLFDAELTLRRRLTSDLGVVVGGSLSSFNPGLGGGGTEQKLYLNWIAYLDGNIPLPLPFLNRQLGATGGGLSVSTAQAVSPTGQDLEYVGYVLRQTLRISYLQLGSNRFRALAFADLTRTQLLEIIGPGDGPLGSSQTFWNAGADATWSLASALSLTASYRYVRSGYDFETPARDNRGSLVLSWSFGVF
jgi:hypothetical protein